MVFSYKKEIINNATSETMPVEVIDDQGNVVQMDVRGICIQYPEQQDLLIVPQKEEWSGKISIITDSTNSSTGQLITYHSASNVITIDVKKHAHSI